MGNRTLTNFRLNEDKKENKSQIFAYNTAQHFRKNKNKKGPGTPRERGKVKIPEKNIDKTCNQKEKINLVDSFTNRASNTKKIEYVYEKNNHSKTLILNSLYDIDERKEKYMWNKTKNNNKKKEIKGIIYKKDKKMAFSYLNNQLDKIKEVNEKKNQVINNNKMVDRNKELKNKAESDEIKKLVDSTNENVTKTLSEILKKGFVKEKSKNTEIEKKKKNSTIILTNAIKDVNIKEIEENVKDNKNIDVNKNDNNKSFDKIIISNKNEQIEKIKIIKTDGNKNSNDVIKDFNQKDNQLKQNKIDANNNIIDKNNQNFLISHNFKINMEFEGLEKLKLKRNKSLSSIKLKNNNNIFIINRNELAHNKSHKNIIRNKINNKKENIKEEKKPTNIKSNKISYQNENIINNSEAIKIIRNKMKENLDKMNKKNKNKKNEKLNKNKNIEKNDNKNQNEKMNQRNQEEYNHKKLIIIKENIKNINIKNKNLNLNKSEKILYKFKNKMNNVIKKAKSFDNFFK